MTCEDALAAALAENARLREALAWYADRAVWQACENGPDCCLPVADLDMGARARVALNRAALAPADGTTP